MENWGAILARWTTDWDCGYKTNWWYVIKDTPFNINALRSKRRYEIIKGNKNFNVNEITEPAKFAENLFNVAEASWATYPASYRPKISRQEYIAAIPNWNYYKIYGAFSVEDNTLCGYALLRKAGKYINFCVLKAKPEKEKQGVNAAIIYKILDDHSELLKNGNYICDGQRNILHDTAFQNYLEKYFMFRKAFCKLHIAYNPKIKFIVNLAFPLRKIINKVKNIKGLGQLSALLKLEELARLDT